MSSGDGGDADGKNSIPLETKEVKQGLHVRNSPSIQKMVKLDELVSKLDDVEALLDYLQSEMTGYHDEIADKFRENAIDGYAFQELEEAHLDEMDMKITLGQKLHLLSKAQKVSRAVRIKRRNRQIFQVKCVNVYPQNKKAVVIMTNSCLKFKFKDDDTKVEEQGGKKYYCCGPRAKLTTKQTVRLMDHVDISLIEDVDFQEIETETTTTTKNICTCGTGKVEKTKTKKNYVWISLALKEEIRSTDLDEQNEFTSMIKVEIADKEQAEKFKEKLIDTVEEVQFEEGARYH